MLQGTPAFGKGLRSYCEYFKFKPVVINVMEVLRKPTWRNICSGVNKGYIALRKAGPKTAWCQSRVGGSLSILYSHDVAMCRRFESAVAVTR